jgi:hypothetical protein
VHVIVAAHRDGASRNGVVGQVTDDLSSLFYGNSSSTQVTQGDFAEQIVRDRLPYGG